MSIGPKTPGSRIPRDPGPDAEADPPPKASAPTPTNELLSRLETHRPSTGRYRVVEEIARGGMGVILKVWDEDLRRSLAMKSLPDEERGGNTQDRLTSEQRMLTRFLEEAQITGQLHHPGIVPVHELGLREEGKAYFTMPLVRGRHLGEIIKCVHEGTDGWTLTRALGVFLKVCEAMAYAHAKGVIHRDLKPANVMVGRYGETYVMDWGLARVQGSPDSRDLRLELKPDSAELSSLLATERAGDRAPTPDSPLVTRDGDVVGTPAYMSLEQAEGLINELGPRSDVYSIGAMLYHLLTGRAPYTPDEGHISARTVLGLLLHGPPTPVAELNPEAPEDLIAVCDKAMNRYAGDRYVDVMEMAEDLLAFLDRRPVKAQPHRLSHVLRLAVERNKPITFTILAACAVLLITAGVFVKSLRDKAEDERQARIEADRVGAENQRRGDFLAVGALESSEPDLYPAVPRMSGELRKWLADLADIESRAVAWSEDHERIGGGRPEGDELEGILAGLGRLKALRHRVEERVSFAESLHAKTIKLEQESWDEAASAIAASEHYAAVEPLTPQLGLVPLRKNSHGLYEFWHVASGTRPEWSGEDGYDLREETGMVFVFLPGGRFLMGSPQGASSSVRAISAGKEVEIPIVTTSDQQSHEVPVEAFFLSKYEVTQAQWKRTFGQNISRYRPGTRSIPFTRMHPVESVSWHECVKVAERLDLRLPTEAEWEYGCRAGQETLFYWGDDPERMREFENIADWEARGATASPCTLWSDGFVHTAPIGSFKANGFGLHDMLGNVTEWCFDEFVSIAGDADPPDGRARLRRFRGGSWHHSLTHCRCSYRSYDIPRGVNQTRGIRLARDLGSD